jgi:hypothetical protein
MNKICEILARLEGKKAIKCEKGNGCVYYQFDSNSRPCVLSEVFSVLKGEDCYNYKISKGEI